MDLSQANRWHFKVVDLFIIRDTFKKQLFFVLWFYNILTQVHGANKWLVNVICCFCATSLNNNRKKDFSFSPFVVKHLKDNKHLFLTKRYLFFSLAVCCQCSPPVLSALFFTPSRDCPPQHGPLRLDWIFREGEKGCFSGITEWKRKHCVVRQSTSFILAPSPLSRSPPGQSIGTSSPESSTGVCQCVFSFTGLSHLLF